MLAPFVASRKICQAKPRALRTHDPAAAARGRRQPQCLESLRIPGCKSLLDQVPFLVT